MKNFNALLFASVCTFAGLTVQADEAPAMRVALKIEQQPVRAALKEFSDQSGVQVLLRVDNISVEGVLAPKVDGQLTVQAALDRLLMNSGLTYEFVNEKTVRIVPVSSSSAQSSPAAAEGRETGNIPVSSTSIRLAQAAGAEGTIDIEQIDEVVVTGTHIRGAEPAGAKVISIGRDEIYRSGYGRIEDVLATLPQNFKGAGEEFNQPNGNNSGGAEIQLRGLGVGTTLTLVNGLRQPSGGTNGMFVDVASIPIAAIERIEILADGASAIYGSDAIGGVANIILREEFTGAESRVRVGSAAGEGEEIQVSQVMGGAWEKLSLLGGYQYYRRDVVPAAARARSALNGDMSSLGGSDYRELFQLYGGSPGTILDPNTGLAAYAIPDGQNGAQLSASDLIAGAANYTDNVTTVDILPRQSLQGAFANLTYRLSEEWKLSANGRFSARETSNVGGPQDTLLAVPDTNPFYVNPFGGSDPVFVAYDFSGDVGPKRATADTDTYAAALALSGPLTDRLNIQLTGSYGHEDSQSKIRFINTSAAATQAALAAALTDSNATTALNAFGDGGDNNPAVMDALVSTNTLEGISTVWSGGAMMDAVLATLPGGSLRMALGADYRSERHRNIRESLDTRLNRSVSNERTVTATFAELALPLIGSGNERRGVHRLDLSLAGRYEDYSDFGSTLDPKVGVAFMPARWARLRGTWGTSFRAPPFFNSSEALGPPNARSAVERDPMSATGTSRVLRLFGNNSALEEETATVRTLGIDLEPQWFEDLTLSLTYFDIRYRDKIDRATPALQTESQWADTIIRNPTQEQIDAICSSGDFIIVGSCAGTFAAILDWRQRNVATVDVEGIDFDLSHQIASPFGRWSFGLGGSAMLSFKQAITRTAPVVDVVDTVGNPLKLQLRGALGWSQGGISASAIVRYTGAYRDLPAPPSREVGSWTTVDLNLGYTFTAPGSVFEDLQLSVALVNALDREPPFVDSPLGYDGANSSILGRLVSAQIVKSW